MAIWLKEIYMTQAQGFEDPEFLDYVYLLLWSLYGLQQSTHQWNTKLDQFLKD
jgi:hypothetical protein